jgi:Flp pilus assembly protein TadG
LEIIMKFSALSRKKENGAVAVTFALLLFLLLGFAGIALDFGHLLVVRTELQTAMDSCALAAAQEMDGQADALTRARNAGITAGNANAVDMQSANWSGKGSVTVADFEFLNAAYASTAVSADVRYVRCSHTQAATTTPLIRILGAFTGVAAYAETMDVAAQAMATLTPAQSACPLPLVLRPKTLVKPDYGYEKGKWYDLLNPGEPLGPGQIGWANLDGSNSASETAAELKGHCGTHIGDSLGTPGFQNSMIDLWNTRFGIYKNNNGPDVDHPDFTGFAYTATSWTKGNNALDDFLQKRQSFTPCADTVSNCEKATGLSLNQFKTVVSGGTGGDLQRYGTNRRLAAVPIADAGNVIDFACMLLLQPIPSPFNNKDVIKLEYVGSASALGSPCTGSGLPGGSAGPLVPVLVR